MHDDLKRAELRRLRARRDSLAVLSRRALDRGNGLAISLRIDDWIEELDQRIDDLSPVKLVRIGYVGRDTRAYRRSRPLIATRRAHLETWVIRNSYPSRSGARQRQPRRSARLALRAGISRGSPGRSSSGDPEPPPRPSAAA